MAASGGAVKRREELFVDGVCVIAAGQQVVDALSVACGCDATQVAAAAGGTHVCAGGSEACDTIPRARRLRRGAPQAAAACSSVLRPGVADATPAGPMAPPQACAGAKRQRGPGARGHAGPRASGTRHTYERVV